jgi:hypothetical protein
MCTSPSEREIIADVNLQRNIFEMKKTVSGDVEPWSVVEVCRRFKVACCVRHQGNSHCFVAFVHLQQTFGMAL